MDEIYEPSSSRPMTEKEWATSRAVSLLIHLKKDEIAEDTQFIQKFMEGDWTVTITNMPEKPDES